MPNAMGFFAQIALKSTALLGVACVTLVFLRGKSAAVRHQVWSLALAAVLALPFFSTLLPAWRVPVESSFLPGGFPFRTQVRGAGGNTTAQQSIPAMPTESKQRVDFGMMLLTLWALGAAGGLVQMSVGWAIVERIRRNAKPIHTPEIDEEIDLRQTAAGGMPITFGLFRPVILLPADAAEWSTERRRVVLLHELAHVQRRDGVTHLLARITLALYWWHPLVWLAWRESVKERERAADDMVLAAGAGASEYASHLLEIARSMQPPMAALAMVRPSQLQDRLAAILDSNRNRKVPRRAVAIAASLAAVVILAPVAAMRAKGGTGQAVTNSQAKANADPATALIDRGKVALAAKNYELAISFFERAEAEDPKETAEAKMWMAITQQQQDNLETAEALFQSALSVEFPNSPGAATITELYAKMLHEQNKEEDATKMANEAAAMRKAQSEQAMAIRPPPSPALHRIGGDVKAPRLLSKVEPEYSADARLAKYSGSVLLAIEIGEDGLPYNIRVARPLGFGLDQKAVEAVAKWKFAPGTLNEQPVAVSAQVEVDFRLQ